MSSKQNEEDSKIDIMDVIRGVGEVSKLFSTDYKWNELEKTRKENKKEFIIEIIISIVFGLVCCGVMYLRFRIFGK